MTATQPLVGLSILPAEDLREASLPLFEEGAVDAIEHTIDATWQRSGLPEWLSLLVDHYAGAGRLYGHGVALSPLSASDRNRRDAWLLNAARELGARRYRHVSEHFGFTGGGDFAFAAPLPVPRSRSAIEAGRDSVARLSELAGAPAGLENLALAFGPEGVDEQAALLEEILAPLDGWVLLDVHNLHCQAHNFGIEPRELLERYPLARVREIHISGGSFRNGLRRDTHDDAVPAQALELLALALERCPSVEVVFLERLGGTIRDGMEAERYREDFRAMKRVVAEAGASGQKPVAPPRPSAQPERVLVDAPAELAALQSVLLHTCDRAETPEAALAALRAAPAAARYATWLDAIEPRMLAVAIDLTRTWGMRSR